MTCSRASRQSSPCARSAGECTSPRLGTNLSLLCSVSGVTETSTSSDALRARVAALEQELAATKSERDKLREAYRNVQLELELMKRRLYVAKAERVDVSQLELEF